MKRGTPHHKKMHALADVLGVRLNMAVGIMEMLWHYAGEYIPEGDIGSVPDKEIARAVDWSGKPKRLVDALVSTGWVDKHPKYRLVIHDWEDHAENSVRKKLGRNRKTFVEGTVKEITSVVYFIKAATSTLIKIGFTEGAIKCRLSDLQSGSTDLLSLIGTIPASRGEENRLHQKFTHLRVFGEWFKPEKELLDYIDSVLRGTLSEDEFVHNGSRSAAVRQPLEDDVRQPSREATAEAGFVLSGIPSEKKTKTVLSTQHFPEFWRRYSKLRDGGSENYAGTTWISLDCDEHAAQVFDCLASYEHSRDVQNGAIMKAENWLLAVKDSGWRARWNAPVTKKSKLEQALEEA